MEDNMQSLIVQLELQKGLIIEQQRKISQLEDELVKSRQKIDELVHQLAKSSDSHTSLKPNQGRYWAPDEHQRFLEALKRFGSKDVKAIATYVGTRNATQVRTHAQKYFLRLERERKQNDGDNVGDKESSEDPLSSDSGNESSGNSDRNAKKRRSPEGDSSDASDSSSGKKKPTKSKSKPRKGRATVMSSLAEAVITMEREKEKKNNNEESEKKKAQNMLLNQLATVSDGLMMERDNQAVIQKIAQESEQHELEKSSTMQKLIAETSEVMLASLGPSWSAHDYTKFVEGLFGTQDERDENKKWKRIKDEYLSNMTIDDIKKCFQMLQSVAKKAPEPPQPTNFKPVQFNPSFGATLNNWGVQIDPKMVKSENNEKISHFTSINFSGGDSTEQISFRFTQPKRTTNPLETMADTSLFMERNNQIPSFPLMSDPFSIHREKMSFPSILNETDVKSTR